VLFALIPIWIGIAITRYRLWDVEVVVNRALIYGPLSAILAGVFAASIAVINLAARDFFGTESTATATVVAALFIATIFQPLRTRIETWVNKRFYPDNANLIKEFIEFSPEVRGVIKLKQLLDVVTRRATALLNVEHAAILLEHKGEFRRAAAYPPAAKAEAVIRPDKAVRTELQKGHTVARGRTVVWVPVYLHRVRNHDVLGVMELGPRKNKTGYSSDDKKALSKLGAEIGVSIYTAQLRESEKR
jgi:K+-sensing histidine kinase KdpD